jgi:hypothetical protein
MIEESAPLLSRGSDGCGLTSFKVPFREKLFPEITFIELTMRVIEENG